MRRGLALVDADAVGATNAPLKTQNSAAQNMSAFRYWLRSLIPAREQLPVVFLVGVIAIVLLVLVADAYQRYQRRQKKRRDIDNASNRPPVEKKVQVLFFFANWCGACQHAKPAWNSFYNTFHDSRENAIHGNVVVHCRAVDCSAAPTTMDPLMTQYSIRHLPSVVLLVDSEKGHIHYRGPITKENLVTFVEDNT